MNIDLIAVLIFLLVLVVLFWIMNDKSAKRVTTSLTSLLQLLPISKIVDALKSKNDNKKTEEGSNITTL